MTSVGRLSSFFKLGSLRPIRILFLEVSPRKEMKYSTDSKWFIINDILVYKKKQQNFIFSKEYMNFIFG